GIILAYYESVETTMKGVICHQGARHTDNWRIQTSLPKFLEHLNIPGIQGIETREIGKKLRVHGTLRGKIADSKENAEKIAAELKIKNVTQGVISRVSTKSPYPAPGSKRNIVVIELVIK